MGVVAHRMGQFFGALRPRVDDGERNQAYGWLNDAQRRVFESMTLRDQQHGIEVCRRVRATAGDDPSMLAAALLHDCGKGEVRLWQRVAYVLLGAMPAWRARIASEDGAEWRRAFWRLLHHPALGAAMVAETGAEPDVVRMIREQEARSPDDRLAILQAADNA